MPRLTSILLTVTVTLALTLTLAGCGCGDSRCNFTNVPSAQP